MPGVGDFLFGSDPSVSNNPYSVIDPTQLEAENQALSAILSNRNPTSYTGQLTAPLSNLQGKSLAAMEESVLPSANAAGSSGTQSFVDANKALQDVLAKGPLSTDAAFNAIAQPVTKAFREQVIPGLEAAYGGSLAGPNSSDYRNAVARSTNDLTQNLSNAAANLSLQSGEDYNTNVARAAALSPSLISTGPDLLTSALSAGSVPQNTQQASDTAAYNEFLRQQGYPEQFIQNLLSLRNFNTTGMNTVVNPGSPGLVNSFLSSPGGSAIAGAGIASALGAGSFTSLLPLLMA